MADYNVNVEQVNSFNKNIKYIINQIEKNLDNIYVLENNIYFEMTKFQIISSFKNILSSLNKWQKKFKDNDIYFVQKEYKQLESDISQLEMCLADYDDIFHCEGMSYALYQIGKILIEIMKED